MKVTNRSDGNIVYSLPELNIRRLFSVGETKEIPNKELEALFQAAGGMELIKDYLLLEDKNWVKSHWQDVPVEYFWKDEEISNCLLHDSQELFQETLDYAPTGVLDIMKKLSWQLPISDLNKIHAILEHPRLMFDVQAAISIMKSPDANDTKAPIKKERRRREEV